MSIEDAAFRERAKWQSSREHQDFAKEPRGENKDDRPAG